MIEELSQDNTSNKFIIFTLSDELYGTELLEVREVVQSVTLKSIPNTVPAFKGVCNLRGQIIGVIDLRVRFGIVGTFEGESVLLVFETESGAIAAIVDGIQSVTLIDSKEIERKPNIVSAVPSRFINGIGKIGERLVTLIDLKNILSAEELTNTAQRGAA